MVLGRGGVIKILEFELNDEEKAALTESVTAVSAQMEATGV